MEKARVHLGKNHGILIAKVATILVVTIFLYSQDLTIIFNDALNSESASHILAIPFIFSYLIYRKRKMLRAVIRIESSVNSKILRYFPTFAGILICAVSILVYWHGSHTFTPLEYHMVSLPIFVGGLILIIFNIQTLRQLAFPIAFLFFLTPPPAEFLYTLGSSLSIVSSEASNFIVNILGVSSQLTSEYGNPALIITRPNGYVISFVVDIACSGIYSVIGFLIFGVFVAYVIRDKLWKKITVLALGLPLVYLLNIIRISLILLIGYHYGEQLALDIFHLLGGWTLIFLGTLFLLFVSENILKTQIFAASKDKCAKCVQQAKRLKNNFCLECGRILKSGMLRFTKVDLAKILAIGIFAVLIISVQAPVFALTQGASIIIDKPTGQVSTEFLPEVEGYNLSFYYRDREFEELAGQDMSLVYLYAPHNRSRKPIWVGVEIAPTRVTLHRWETCLIKYGARAVTQLDLREVQLYENPPIIGRYFIFQHNWTKQLEAVLYWFESPKFAVNSTMQRKHVKISVIGYPDTLEEIEIVEKDLLLVAEEITNYWQPIKTWSGIALVLSQNSSQIFIIAIFILACLGIAQFLERRRIERSNFSTYNKLSEVDKQLVDAIQKVQKERVPTLRDISKAYRLNNKRVRQQQLFNEVSRIEKTGVLRSSIFNKNDVPILIWRLNMNP